MKFDFDLTKEKSGTILHDNAFQKNILNYQVKSKVDVSGLPSCLSPINSTERFCGTSMDRPTK